jgi:predicted nucleic-acid-binding protein
VSAAPPVLALDTNVLLRALVEDDAAQTARAGRWFRKAGTGEARLLLLPIVLCEAVWVLESWYRLPRAEIAGCLERLLLADGLEIADRETVARALESYRAGKGDFADYAIREGAEARGAAAVLTFDAALLKESGFRAP